MPNGRVTSRGACKSRHDPGVKSVVVKCVGLIMRRIVKDDNVGIHSMFCGRLSLYSNGAVMGSHKRLAFRFDRHGRDTPKVIKRVHSILPEPPSAVEVRFRKAIQGFKERQVNHIG